MATFSKHDLYGGAISCQLPSDYLDSSNVREIPSHQEVWLSRTTLTNVIIEINQYETSQANDAGAVTYHFTDVIDADDTLHNASQPTLVQMKGTSVANFPAYVMSGEVMTAGGSRGAGAGAARGGSAAAATLDQTRLYQLVVRVKDVDTDLCVRINVPLKEFKGNEEAAAREIQLGQEILMKVIDSLEIVDFGLFDG